MKTFSPGGVSIHPKSHIEVSPFLDDSLFLDEQEDERIKLLIDILFLAKNGRKANIKRHIAELKLQDGQTEKCMLDINLDGHQVNQSIGAYEILVTNDIGETFYTDSSIIFAIAKYRYKPSADFRNAIANEVERITKSG